MKSFSSNKKSAKCTFLLLTLVILVPSFVGCKKDSNDPTPKDSKEIFLSAPDQHVKETVKIINDSLLTHIANITDSEINLKNTSEVGHDVKKGDIIVAGISEEFPYGLLRKVETISLNGDNMKLTTSHATLNDVFKYGKIEINEPLLDSAQIQSGNKASRTNESSLNINYVYDKDKNPATDKDRITLDLNGKMTPGFVFEWEKAEGATIPNHVKMALENTVELSVQTMAIIDQFGDDRIQLFKKSYKPVAKIVFGVPIVFRPEIGLYTGFSITNPIDIKFGFKMKKKFSAGFLYHEGDWSSTNSDDLETDFIPPLSIKETFTIKSTVFHAELVAYPYGIDAMQAYVGAKFGTDNVFNCATKSFNIDFWAKGDFGFRYQFSFFNGLLQGSQDFNKDIDLFSKHLDSGPVPCGAAGSVFIIADSIPRLGGGWDHGFRVTITTNLVESTSDKAVVWYNLGVKNASNGWLGPFLAILLKAPPQFSHQSFTRGTKEYFLADNSWKSYGQTWGIQLNHGIFAPETNQYVSDIISSRLTEFTLPFPAQYNRGFTFSASINM